MFQLDFSNPLNDSSKVEMGLRSFWKQTDQVYLFQNYNYDETAYVQDNGLSQSSHVNENVNAAYVTYSSRLPHNINYQLGLRMEESSLDGISRLDSTPNFGYNFGLNSKTKFLDLFFPSLFISKKIDDNNEIGFNISRKIGRPNFFQLMPGVRGSDKQNITIGNTGLQPEFTNKAEVNYNKIFGSNNWLTSIYASLEDNTIKPFTTPSLTDPNVLVTTFVNGKSEFIYGLDNTLKLGFGKNLEVTANVNIFNFSVTVDTFSNKFWTGNGKIGLTYHLPANWTVQINGNYQGKRPQAQGYNKAVAFMDFAVKKSFFHNAANLTFLVSDVFDSRKDVSVYEVGNFYQETMRRRDMRFFKISLQMPFGSPDASLFKKRDKKGQDDQQGGMQDGQ